MGLLPGLAPDATTTLVGHANLVKQVRFPRQLLPFSVVGDEPRHAVRDAGRRSCRSRSCCFPRRARRSGRRCRWSSRSSRSRPGSRSWSPARTSLFRDVEHLVAAVLLPWFFLTPIFYTFDALPGLEGREWIGDLLYYGNVFVPILEAIRDPLFFGEWPPGHRRRLCRHRGCRLARAGRAGLQADRRSARCRALAATATRIRPSQSHGSASPDGSSAGRPQTGSANGRRRAPRRRWTGRAAAATSPASARSRAPRARARVPRPGESGCPRPSTEPATTA